MTAPNWQRCVLETNGERYYYGLGSSLDCGELFGGSGLPVVSHDRLKEPDDLLLACGHTIKLSAHLDEAVVDMGAQVCKVLPQVDEILPEVDEILPKGVEACSGRRAEVAKLATELSDVAVGGAGENTGGRRVLLAGSHSPAEVAYLLLESTDAWFEIPGVHEIELTGDRVRARKLSTAAGHSMPSTPQLV